MVASAIFILDLKGKIIISRNYRGEINMELAEDFISLLKEREEESHVATPIICHDGINYVYLRHNDLYCRIKLF